MRPRNIGWEGRREGGGRILVKSLLYQQTILVELEIKIPDYQERAESILWRSLVRKWEGRSVEP